MRLHAMLTLPGGNPEQGRPIALRLRYRGPGGVPHTREVAALMLPISDVEELAARRAAQAGPRPREPRPKPGPAAGPPSAAG